MKKGVPQKTNYFRLNTRYEWSGRNMKIIINQRVLVKAFIVDEQQFSEAHKFSFNSQSDKLIFAIRKMIFPLIVRSTFSADTNIIIV